MALGKLQLGTYQAHAIVLDNASRNVPTIPARLENSISVQLIESPENLGTAARNLGVRAAPQEAEWIIMLDDDSAPIETPETPFYAFVQRLCGLPRDVAAVSAEIVLPGQGCRESGGLPEVFIGCGVAIRRNAFLDAGGYDPSFGYYVEEYDLAARFLLAGLRVAHDPGFVVEHHKVAAGRDMNQILARLVRNNGFVLERYAPESVRQTMLEEMLTRYKRIAAKEHALEGYAKGRGQLEESIESQLRSPMPSPIWDRFTGLAHAREALQAAWKVSPFCRYALVDEGKNAWAVRQALVELSDRVEREGNPPLEGCADHRDAQVCVVSTLSPGPMRDALARWSLGNQRVVVPWLAVQAPLAQREIVG